MLTIVSSSHANDDKQARSAVSTGMNEIGRLIRKARKDKRLTLEELAQRIGVSRSAVNQWELGTSTPESKRFPSICSVLEIDPRDLHADASAPDQRPVDGIVTRGAASSTGRAIGGVRQMSAPFGWLGAILPVFGSYDVGGGIMMLTEEPIGPPEPRPSFAGESTGAFGVIVEHDMMSPAYRRGDRLLLLPHKPAVPGDDVVLFSAKPGEARKVRSVVRHLLQRTETHWVCEQHNPHKREKFALADFPLCYRVESVRRR